MEGIQCLWKTPCSYDLVCKSCFLLVEPKDWSKGSRYRENVLNQMVNNFNDKIFQKLWIGISPEIRMTLLKEALEDRCEVVGPPWTPVGVYRLSVESDLDRPISDHGFLGCFGTFEHRANSQAMIDEWNHLKCM